MNARKAAPAVGVAACLLVLAVLAVPYAAVGPPSAVGTYYAAGAITPFAGGLLAVVGVVVFGAGWGDRSDPAVTAGAGLVLGGFVVLIALLWAVTVPRSVVTQLSTSTLLVYHRGALVLAGAAVAGSAAWYVRALGLP